MIYQRVNIFDFSFQAHGWARVKHQATSQASSIICEFIIAGPSAVRTSMGVKSGEVGGLLSLWFTPRATCPKKYTSQLDDLLQTSEIPQKWANLAAATIPHNCLC